MKRITLAVVIAWTVSAGAAQAIHPHYGSCGVQFGFYKNPPQGYTYPAGGAGYANPSAGYGYANSSPGYGYATPGYGYSTPNYGYAAPSGGCTGGGGYGYSYGVPSYSPNVGAGYGYGAPSYSPNAGAGYGYGYGTPQAGLFPIPGFPGGGMGSILDTIRAIKDIAKELDLGRSDPKVDTATKAEIQTLRDEIKGIQATLTNLSVPLKLEARLTKIDQDQEKAADQIKKIIKALEKADPSIKVEK